MSDHGAGDAKHPRVSRLATLLIAGFSCLIGSNELCALLAFLVFSLFDSVARADCIRHVTRESRSEHARHHLLGRRLQVRLTAVRIFL